MAKKGKNKPEQTKQKAKSAKSAKFKQDDQPFIGMHEFLQASARQKPVSKRSAHFSFLVTTLLLCAVGVN